MSNHAIKVNIKKAKPPLMLVIGNLAVLLDSIFEILAAIMLFRRRLEKVKTAIAAVLNESKNRHSAVDKM